MRDRHRHMIAKVETLDLDWNRSVENRRKLHAGFFLAKVYMTGPLAFDVSAQTGYFFKWHAGPYSESLRDSFAKAASHLRHEGLSDLSQYELDAYKVAADVIHNGPCEECVENGLWARMLSMIAYLDSGDWSTEGQREEIVDALGGHTAEHYDDGYETLYRNDMASLFSSKQQRERILTQMERVRQSGEVNMVDAKGVQRVANNMDLHALVGFLGRRPADGYHLLLDEFSEWRAEEDLDAEHEYAERALDL